MSYSGIEVGSILNLFNEFNNLAMDLLRFNIPLYNKRPTPLQKKKRIVKRTIFHRHSYMYNVTLMFNALLTLLSSYSENDVIKEQNKTLTVYIHIGTLFENLKGTDMEIHRDTSVISFLLNTFITLHRVVFDIRSCFYATSNIY